MLVNVINYLINFCLVWHKCNGCDYDA